jgi:putative membrane protein
MNLLAQTTDYPGTDGFLRFLGFRGSLMLDVVFLAMFAVLPALAASIYLVKQRRYELHKKLQLALGIVLLLAVVAFEVDVRLNKWEPRAEPSPYFAGEVSNGEVNMDWSCPIGVALIIHLFFAIPTAFIWTIVIIQALRKFPDPPHPGMHSASHKFWGWLAVFEMFGTAITGWIFYYLAFVAV